MRTSKCILLLGLFLGIASSTMEVRAADLTSVSIDPNDIQLFEQSYESWVQGIIQGVIPQQKATVLVDMSYTQNPERLQTYSELRVAQHLPGLPEVMDPHFTHPSESPLSALLESRKIKIIFEHALTAQQEKVLAEVLNSKLKINAAAGDQLTLSTLEVAAAPEKNRFNDPKFVLNLVFGCLVLAALLSRNRKNKLAPVATEASAALIAVPPPAPIRQVTPPPPPVKPFTFSDQDRTIINRLVDAKSDLTSKTASIVSPTQIILKSEPKAIIRVIRSESAENIARAIHGTSILFQKTILSICTSRQRNQIREVGKSIAITKGGTIFAQNLIAAKIHREMQSLALKSIDQYVKAADTVKTERGALNQIRLALTETQQQPKNSERSQEVQL